MTCMGNLPSDVSELHQQTTPVVVVVIDDDTLILLATAKALASAGMVCHTATTGEAGLRLIREHKPDIVLLDILLIGEDGFTFCREIRRTWSPEELPVIMVTSLEDHKSIKAAYESGANDFLTKPVHWMHLPYRIWHVLQANRDLTERKRVEAALRESERKLSVIMESVDAYIYLKDIQGRYLFANRKVRELFGATMEEVVGQSDEKFFDAGTLARLRHNDRLVLTEGQTVKVEETNLNLKDGCSATYLTIKQPLCNEAGEIYALCGVSTDITEQKQLEVVQAALEAQSHLRQKTESLGLMAGAIAHHFNNHLQSVMANLELLGDPPKGMDPARFLTRAKQATERAAEMSRLLLIYLGRIPGLREPRFLFEICHNSLTCLRETLPASMALETDYSSPGPVISANADLIQQVLTNLVVNARDALGAAGGSIRLSLKTCSAADISTAHRFPIGWQPQGSDYACLEVSDTGCGIRDTDINKLFDPFFSTKFTGRGMGLPVTLGIVQAHGGAITVESKQGQGSAFRAYFPVATGVMLGLPEGVVQSTNADGGGGTILLIDDDDMLLESAGTLIETLGFTLLTANDGAEALGVFQQHKDQIRCVISDLTMPRMDGWETLTALRQLDPALPVILASGYDKAQVMASPHPDRPQAFLNKPFHLQQLREALGQALGLNRKSEP